MTSSTLIRGGTVVDPIDGERTADVLIENGRIQSVASGLTPGEGVDEVDAGGRLILPGFVDAHSHADARVLEDDVQLALLRQGVTTVVVGQDGVSFAPGDGRYASDYFGAINGPALPGYDGTDTSGLLRAYHRRTRLGVGYLVPAGTVRHEVMGYSDRAASPTELAKMVRLVEDAMRQGALGLSSGLDYVPGCFATTRELTELCRPVARAGGLYVTHMRGYEENSARGVREALEISSGSGVETHLSHFHARSELMGALLTEARDAGHEMTFDAYPYMRGSSILSMLMVPPTLTGTGNAAAARALRDPRTRSELTAGWLADRFRQAGDGWPRTLTIASAEHPEWKWTEGSTLDAIALRLKTTPAEAGYQMLADCELRVTVVMNVINARGDDDLATRFSLPGAMCGSDGIFAGSHPHPRAYSAFTRMIEVFNLLRSDFNWTDTSRLLSGNAARRFRLPDRGRIAVGAVADIVLVDPAALTAGSTYDRPTVLASGIDDVLVAGERVLADGVLTPALPGGPIRREGTES